jgi:DNA-binding response OmpR family regulator
MTVSTVYTYSKPAVKWRRKRETAVEFPLDLFRSPAPSGPSRGYVLVVDDCVSIADILGRMLIEMGYEVAQTTNGRDALELAWLTRPDLILLDTSLPDVSSQVVYATLRQKARTRQIPIILMSVFDETTEWRAGFHAAEADFMMKPILYEALRRRVELRMMEVN